MMRNKCIDTLKGISCILVLFIHCPFPGNAGEFIKAIARCAVPYFFLISGYFYGGTAQEKKDKTAKKMINRLGKLFIYGVVLSLPFIISARKSLPFFLLDKDCSFRALARLLLFNDTGEIYHLWFLLALIYCYLVDTVLNRLQISRNGYMQSIGILMLILICFSLEFISRTRLEINIVYYRNWLFLGLPFFSAGVLYRKRRVTVAKYIPLLLIVLGLLLSLVECMIFQKMDLYCGSVLLSVGMLLFSIENPKKEIRGISLIGNRYSPWIYALQWSAMRLEYKLGDMLDLFGKLGNGYLWLKPVIFFCITWMLAFIIPFFDKRVLEKGITWIRNKKRNTTSG